MSPPNKKIYRVRNHLHKVIGTFSKREVLEMIAEGRITEQHEVSVGPEDRWHKIASHPDFFDALIQIVSEGKYGKPAGGKSETKSKQLSVRPTELGATRQLLDKPEPPPETANISSPEEKGKGGTIHESSIEALFKSSQKSIKLRESEDPLESSLPMREERDFVPPMPPAQKKATKTGSSRRTKLWAAVLGALVLLYYLGGEEEPKKIAEETESKSTERQALSPDQQERELKALVSEGDALNSLDLVPAYGAAADVLRQALAIDETDATILGEMAESLARQAYLTHLDEKAVSEIQALVARGRTGDPQASAFYRTESLMLLAAKDLQGARDKAISAANSDPLSAESALLVGEIELLAKNYSEAGTQFENARKLGIVGVRGHSLRARALLFQRDYAGARSAAMEGLKQNPFHSPTLVVVGDVASAGGNLAEAKAYYEAAAKVALLNDWVTTGMAHKRRGEILEALGRQEEASMSFRLAKYYAPELAGLDQKTHGMDLSRGSLEKLAKDFPHDRDYYIEQSQSFQSENKLKESAKFMLAAYLCAPNDPEMIVRLGESVERVAGSYEDFRRVLNLYQRAVDLNPEQVKGYVRLGLLETEQYNFDRAYTLLRQAEALAPEDPDVLVALLKHFYKRQDYAEAVKYLQKAKGIASTNSEVNYYAGLLRLLIKKDAEKDALPLFHQAYLQDPRNYDALAEWLKLKVLSFDKTFASKFVRTLLETDKDNPKLYWALGEVYAANKEFRRAIPFYHNALDLDNRGAKVRMSLGEALEAVGQMDQAVEEYRLASLLDRRNTTGFYKAADLLFHMGKFKDAEETLKFLIGVTPHYPGARRYLSKIYRLTRQRDLAVKRMREEVESNPVNASYRIELAELLMEYQKFDEAIVELVQIANLPSIQKAPEFVYDKIRSYLLLSRCYRAQNKLESAEGSVKLALDIDPGDPELHKELGYVYYGMQRDKEGVKEFELYLARNPAATDSENVKKLIRDMQIEE